jgi:hypothetical protein
MCVIPRCLLAPYLQAAASRLLLHDLSPAPPAQPHLPPPVRGHLLPRIAKLLTADRLSISHSSRSGGYRSSSGGGSSNSGPHSLTRVELHDLTAEGYAGEAGSFLARWAPHLCWHCFACWVGSDICVGRAGFGIPVLARQPQCRLLAHAACAGCTSGRQPTSA